MLGDSININNQLECSSPEKNKLEPLKITIFLAQFLQ